MLATDLAVKDAWFNRHTLPLRIEAAAARVRKGNGHISMIDIAVKEALLRHDYARAFKVYEHLRRDVVLHEADRTIMRPILHRLVIISLLTGRKKKAKTYCNKFVFFSDSSNPAELVEALNLNGFVQFYFGNLKAALVSWKEASYKVRSDDKEVAALLFNNLACLHWQIGSIGEATKCLEQSSTWLKDLSSKLSILHLSITEGNCAALAECRNDYPSALAHLQESLFIQASILPDHSYVVRATKDHINRVAVSTVPDNQSASAIDVRAIESTEWRQPLFLEISGMTLAENVKDVGGVGDLIPLGSLEKEWFPRDRIRSMFSETFGHFTGSGPTQLSRSKRSSLPVDIDGSLVVSADTKLTEIYEQATQYLLIEDFSEALDLLKACHRSVLSKFGKLHPLVAVTLHNIGIVYVFAGKYDSALEAFQQAVGVATTTVGIYHEDVSASLMKIGLLQVATGDHISALVSFSQILHSRRKALGYYHPQTVRVLNNIASVHYMSGNLLAATKCAEEAVQILRKSGTRDRKSSHTMAVLLGNHAFILFRCGQNDQASVCYQESLVLMDALYAKDHSLVSLTAENLRFIETENERQKTIVTPGFFSLMRPLECGSNLKYLGGVL